ncbi:ankyrin repeat domain-containing protein [bacterium]|nr:ankyrin repeat domain-containing protein [bacterium]
MDDQQLLDADLIDSIQKYDFNRFKHLLDSGADPNSLYLDNIIGHITPLMEAANMNHPRYVIELLNYGADPNIVIESGTALHFALMNENSMILLYLLLKNGANPFLKDDEDDTPYDMAVNDNLIQEAELLKRWMDFHRVQRVGRRYLTRKRIKTNRANRRLALSKHMLDDDNSMSYMDYDTILELSKYM